jgi:quinol monooxygenase YgiN
MPFVVVAVYLTQAGREESVTQALNTLQTASRGEPGCRLFVVQRDRDVANRFVLYEQYEDEAAYARHQETDHFERIVRGQIIPMLESRERMFLSTIEPEAASD